MPIVNYITPCGKNLGGNSYLFLTEAVNIIQVTVSGGEVTDIVMASGTAFRQIQFDTDTLKRRFTGNRTKRSFIFYDHLVEFICSKASVAQNVLSVALADASPCGVVAIVMDANSKAWLVGYSETELVKRPLYLNINEFNSGDLPTAVSGNGKFTLTGQNDQIDLPADDTINDYITGSIAAGTDLTFTP